MNWRTLLLVFLVALFSFGGSFECRSENGSARFDDDDNGQTSTGKR